MGAKTGSQEHGTKRDWFHGNFFRSIIPNKASCNKSNKLLKNIKNYLLKNVVFSYPIINTHFCLLLLFIIKKWPEFSNKKTVSVMPKSAKMSREHVAIEIHLITVHDHNFSISNQSTSWHLSVKSENNKQNSQQIIEACHLTCFQVVTSSEEGGPILLDPDPTKYWQDIFI